MMTELPRLASLVLNQPHHILPEAAEAILAALGERIGLQGLVPPEPEANSWTGRNVVSPEGRWQGYRVTETGVAIISVQGELVNRGSWLGARSGLVSYEGLRQALRNAAADRAVHAIVLDVDSPGGMAAGMLETAALVRRINAEKRVYAVANGAMASAAYGISSGAHAVIASELGPIGSIGTVVMHVDHSRQIAKRGLAVTFIHAGAHKVDGHAFAPLPDHVRAEIQARVDAVQDRFVRVVAEGRLGRTDERRVRETEARTFMGPDAVAWGLADGVGTFDQVVELLELTAIARSPPKKNTATARQKQSATAPAPTAALAAPVSVMAARRERFVEIANGGPRGAK